MFRLLPLLAVLAGVTVSFSARAEERTRFFELQPQVGFSYVNLTGFSQEEFQDDVSQDLSVSLDDGQIPVEGTGPSAGIGAQLKVWVFVLGARYNYTHTSEFAMQTVAGDLGLRLGDTVALYGRAGLGLAFLSDLPAELTTDGFVIPASGGLDFKLGDAVSLGLGLDLEVLLLTQAQKLQDAAQRDLDIQEIDRDTVGFHIRPQLHLTWHI
jgi:hypothetical protein